MRRPSSSRGRSLLGAQPHLPVLLLVPALLLAACGGPTGTRTPQPSVTASASGSAPTTGPVTASSEPSSTPTPETTAATSSDTPSSSPGTSPGGGSASAAACSGSNDNRDFFASLAAAVDWPVYCPVLPDGWLVESGQYRLAGGGRVEVAYGGPDRARITLDEGAFCTIQGGCVPPGQDVGPTAFDGHDGLLVALDDGSWAVALDREASLSWLLVVTGLDEATARSIAAGLVVVGG